MKISLLFFTLILSASCAFANAEPVGKIVSIQGILWKEKQRARIDLKEGAPVYAGEVLKTAADTKVKVTLGDEAALLIGSHSRVLIQKPEMKNWLIELKEGSLLSYFKKKLDIKQEPYQVKTQAATIGVRGTTFFIEAKPHEHDYFCACNGQVKLKTKTTSELLKTEHHDSPKFVEADGKIVLTDVKKGHTDAEIEELKNLLK